VEFTRRQEPTAVRQWIWLGALVLGLAGCGQAETPQAIEETFESALVDTTVDYSHLQYATGELSLNDRCPIRRDRLNPKVRPLFVNGKPLGFC
jgi:hypothetical protein